ncbi:MAG: Gfo/Idh/MocA family oxidoreductase [Gemmatimonadota bacterium]
MTTDPRDPHSRRDFVATSAKLAAAAAIFPTGFPTIVPRHVLGRGFQAPSDTLNFATVGFGGMGSGNSQELCKTENLCAVCDVDLAFAARNAANKNNEDGVKLKAQYEKAPKYTDFREMLEKQKDIDAVLVATPDHLHATVAAAAMRAGKHVYVQKPLTWSVYEARMLKKLALDNPKLVTQNGNQGHSSEGTRRIVEWVQAGIIGPIREVHIYTNRPASYWAQGLPRPGAAGGAPATLSRGAIGPVNTALAAAMAAAPSAPPDGLRWDLYLGPVAEDIGYHPIYHPFSWRGWIDFGMGALGDMGAHLVDQSYWALGLTQPTSIEATSTLWGAISVPPPEGSPQGTRPTQRPVSFPMATTVHYQFPARGAMPPVKLNWYDGGLYPPRPDSLPDDVVLTAEGGGILIGEKGVIVHNTYGNNPRVYPMSLADAEKAVPKSVPRIQGSHELNWANAIKGTDKASSPFSYAAELTETMLLGMAALRAGQGRKVIYDAAKMEFTNAPNANQYLTRDWRKGWELK